MWAEEAFGLATLQYLYYFRSEYTTAYWQIALG